jgi:hypothetical protein
MAAQHRYKEAGLQYPAGRNQSTKHMIIREHGLTPGHESRDGGDDGMVSKNFPCRNSYQSCSAVWHYRLARFTVYERRGRSRNANDDDDGTLVAFFLLLFFFFFSPPLPLRLFGSASYTDSGGCPFLFCLCQRVFCNFRHSTFLAVSSPILR